MSTDTGKLKGFCAAKQYSIFAGKLMKISAQGHNWNPPKMAILFSNPHKILACTAAKQQKYHMKILFHQLTSDRSSGSLICKREQVSVILLQKNSMSLLLVVFEK